MIKTIRTSGMEDTININFSGSHKYIKSIHDTKGHYVLFVSLDILCNGRRHLHEDKQLSALKHSEHAVFQTVGSEWSCHCFFILTSP